MGKVITFPTKEERNFFMVKCIPRKNNEDRKIAFRSDSIHINGEECVEFIVVSKNKDGYDRNVLHLVVPKEELQKAIQLTKYEGFDMV